MKIIGLTPAYGRDYKSIPDVIVDFEGDKDFIISDITNKYCGKPANRKDLLSDGYEEAHIRYSALTKVAVLKL